MEMQREKDFKLTEANNKFDENYLENKQIFQYVLIYKEIKKKRNLMI